MTSFDIILPLYRPKPDWEEHVLECMKNLRAYFAGRDVALGFLLVNDGSPLSHFPEKVLDELRKTAGNFRFLTYCCNRGKGYSLRYAVERSSADLIVYTDGDFPFGWKSAADAFEKLFSGADVVMGVRGSDYAEVIPPVRRLLSRTVRRVNSLLLGLPLEYIDTQAGLKGFNRKGRELFLSTTVNTFLFDTEFIFLAWRGGLRLETIPLTLRSGLHFSRMGFRVMFREGGHFLRILAKRCAGRR